MCLICYLDFYAFFYSEILSSFLLFNVLGAKILEVVLGAILLFHIYSAKILDICHGAILLFLILGAKILGAIYLYYPTMCDCGAGAHPIPGNCID